MGKMFGGVTFFLVAVLLAYLFNFSALETYVLSYDPFEAAYMVAAFEVLHHPFAHLGAIPAWLIAGFLSGLVCRSWKGALLVSIFTGLILSTTWIFFMSRYLPTYWTGFLSSHPSLEFYGVTIGLGLLLGLLAAVPAMGSGYLLSPRTVLEQSPMKEIKTICPKCGTSYQSKPKYCYKCNTLLYDSPEKVEN